MLALDRALTRLEEIVDRGLAQIVELRAFGWIDDRRSGARAEGVAVDGQTGVANRESVAHARTRARRRVVTAV